MPPPPPPPYILGLSFHRPPNERDPHWPPARLPVAPTIERSDGHAKLFRDLSREAVCQFAARVHGLDEYLNLETTSLGGERSRKRRACGEADFEALPPRLVETHAASKPWTRRVRYCAFKENVDNGVTCARILEAMRETGAAMIRVRSVAA